MRQEERLSGSSKAWPPAAPSAWPRSPPSWACPPHPSAATCSCSRSSGCCHARTAARWPTAPPTSCRCAIGAVATAPRSAASPARRRGRRRRDGGDAGAYWRHDDHRGRPPARRPERAHDRHECSQYRLLNSAMRPELKLIVTGGAARSESYELVGPLAEATLEGMNLDLAVVGVDGVTADGGADVPGHRSAHEPRHDRSRPRVIVVADGSKGGASGPRAHLTRRRGRADHRRLGWPQARGCCGTPASAS